MTIEEATANLVDAMQRTSSGELLRLAMSARNGRVVETL